MARRKLTEEEKAEKKRLEQEERIRLNVERGLKDLRDSYINEPTRHFQVGDEVKFGNIKRTIITEVLDGGKIYKTHQVVTETNYGRPYDYEREMYVAWHDLFPPDNPGGEELFEHDDVCFSFSQRMVGSMISMYYRPGVDLDPDYQRGNVWMEEQKVALVDSVFRGIDIGKFAVIRRPFSTKGKLYEMLDGKQRLTALVEFYEDRFPYKGKLFSQLHWRDQASFMNCSVSEAEASNMTEKQKYHYFLKLNTSGMPQDPAHMEKVRKLYEESE